MGALQAGSMPLRVLRSGSSGSPDTANGELSPATFMLTAIGLYGAGYLLTSQLFGVTPWDPLLLAGATVLLGSAALVAAVIPAQRASGTDPILALRNE